MTVTTFESLILTFDDKLTFLEANNEKLSEIIGNFKPGLRGWPLFFLLLFTSLLSGGMVIVIIQLNLQKTYKL